ncbi:MULTISPECIES: hypothetical protein [unclassified Curtobacterium]|uniref:hypothetical protein n=1 Tax=unclassified Curtobacterium TaxID=257496 RepID=UPI000DA8FFBC|nr:MULTISPECIES: hypothetical protein [unclassified Curtobacterium]PZE26435.1 hypothetical protein DEI86_08075 [Curtobacterium sp. MCBD17_028]PZE75092.1 hypothetical protein DEI82_09495 [Curtobacterium sp. MCBD17_019]WIE53587.1 hypothetical protein DEI88_010530 [Curtobacterium sp. MCBD17_003]
MRASLPAGVATALAAIFSLYHLVLAVTSLSEVRDVQPVIACMVLYVAATAAALVTTDGTLPVWSACFALATSVVMPLVIAPEVPPASVGTGYATWYVAAVGTLMVILVVRQRTAFAWIGVGFLALHSVLWAGPGGLASLGVIGSLSWVAIASAFVAAMNGATRVLRDFVRAEQETVDWQAAQDAHVHERQFRLEQTTRMALPMLQRIIATCGDLSAEERLESVNLEGAIRDEIRGRSLLSDEVRHEVMALRRAGATVQLLDEGGLDELEDEDRARVHAELARGLRAAAGADTVVIRTVPGGSDTAVTVVGLRLDGDASESAALGAGLDDEDGDEDDSVVLWLEIPRHLDPRPAG